MFEMMSKAALELTGCEHKAFNLICKDKYPD